MSQRLFTTLPHLGSAVVRDWKLVAGVSFSPVFRVPKDAFFSFSGWKMSKRLAEKLPDVHKNKRDECSPTIRQVNTSLLFPQEKSIIVSMRIYVYIYTYLNGSLLCSQLSEVLFGFIYKIYKSWVLRWRWLCALHDLRTAPLLRPLSMVVNLSSRPRLIPRLEGGAVLSVCRGRSPTPLHPFTPRPWERGEKKRRGEGQMLN